MSEAFLDSRDAGLDLLTHCRDMLSFKEGGFLGHVAVSTDISERQRDWLVKLLQRHGRPPLRDGGAR